MAKKIKRVMKAKRLVMSDNVVQCIIDLWGIVQDHVTDKSTMHQLMFDHSLIINEAFRREKEPSEL